MVAMAAIHALIHDASLTQGSYASGSPRYPGPRNGVANLTVIRADQLVQVEIESNVNHDSLGINSRVLDGSIADATLQVPIAGSRSLDRFALLSTFLVSVDSSSTSGHQLTVQRRATIKH